MPREIEEGPKVLNCPQCGAPLAAGAVGCSYCQSEFVQAVGVAAQKPVSQVVEKDGKKMVGDISFEKKLAFNDEQLKAIAGQVAVAMVDEPRGKIKHYFDFSLSIPPQPGRPRELLVQALRSDDPIIKVSFWNDFGLETHQRLQAKGRVIRLPEEVS